MRSNFQRILARRTRHRLCLAAVATSLAGCGLMLPGPAVDITDHNTQETPRVIERPTLVGAEDITIDQHRGIAFVSCTDRHGDLVPEHANAGSIWSYSIENDSLRRIDSSSGIDARSFRPHGISLFGKGDTQRLFVINHRTGVREQRENLVEMFATKGGQLRHLETVWDRDGQGARFVHSLNDLVAVGERQFFATHPGHNEEVGTLTSLWDVTGSLFFWKAWPSSVVYFDGDRYREVDSGLGFANGITADVDKGLLYVSTSQTSELRVYRYDKQTGELDLLQTVVLGGMLDNIEWHGDKHLLIGTHASGWSFLTHSVFDWAGPGYALRVALDKNGLININAAEKIAIVDGQNSAGLSVAAIWKNVLLTGQVFRRGIYRYRYQATKP